MNLFPSRRVLPLLAAAFLSTSADLARADSSAGELEATSVAVPSAGARARKWSVYWGWNRSGYSASDIHFSGVDHDFTLSAVKAHDSPTTLSLDSLFHTYLHPGRLSIPQTNLRLAYQYDDDSALALNLDHMKYVMTAYQVAPISGTIQGVAKSGTQTLSPDFLQYEHTDGLNIISVEYEKQMPLKIFGAGLPVRGFGLVGMGVVLPKSNVTLAVLNQPRNDEFHLAGYSAHLGAGVEADVFERYFIRTAVKVGRVDLPDVWTSARGDKASQAFNYREWLLAVGVRF